MDFQGALGTQALKRSCVRMHKGRVRSGTECRIWQRIGQERAKAIGGKREPLCAATLGKWAQVDWDDAVADLSGERQTVRVFSMRSMASGGEFHLAYSHTTQQALLEAHERACGYFGGVFRRLKYRSPSFTSNNFYES
jgi:transposase